MKLKKATEVKAEAPGSDAASNDAGTP